jgi:uncharacterized membrane protein YphA (DoxX/SURF4 family)
MFVYGGVDALRDPESKAKAADDVAPMIAEALHLPTTDTVTLVRINGGIQVAAGTMLALGKFRRLSALTLAASLIPTTYAGHRFWEEVDEDRRAQQRVQFLKNAGMLGGLIFAAGDTGGRPSVPWQARRAAKHAAEAAIAAGAATQGLAKHVVASGGDARATATGAAGDLAQQLANLAHSTSAPDMNDLGRRARKAAASVTEAANKAQKADLTKRARKRARKAMEKAQKIDVAKTAQRAAKRAEDAELTKRAIGVAKKARHNAEKMAKKSDVAARASAAASRTREATADAVAYARDHVADVDLGQARDRALELAHHGAQRAKDALPVGG